MKKLFVFLTFLFVGLAAQSFAQYSPYCGLSPYSCTPTPTGTITSTPTPSPTNTPSKTPTFTPTPSPTKTPTKTPSNTPTTTPSISPTNTPTLSATAVIPVFNPGNPGSPTNLYNSGLYWSSNNIVDWNNSDFGLSAPNGNLNQSAVSAIAIEAQGGNITLESDTKDIVFQTDVTGYSYSFVGATGELNMGGNPVSNISAPTVNSMAANKLYTDTHIQGSIVTPVPTYIPYNGTITTIAGITSTPVAHLVHNGLIVN